MLGDCLAWIASLLFGLLSYLWLIKKYPTVFRRSNFLQRSIPTSAGIIIALASETALIWMLRERFARSASIVECSLLCICGFGVLGLLDDVYGDRTIGGLKGHFQTALRDKKITTGFVKAVGGTALALVSGWILHPDQPLMLLIASAIIALSANAANLADTRPGRSLFFVLIFGALGGAVLIGRYTATIELVFLPTFSLAFILFLLDRKASLMIGDSGANSFGAASGLLWALGPLPMQIVFLIFLVWFQLWTERNSLSKAIEKVTVLKSIDSWIGLRN